MFNTYINYVKYKNIKCKKKNIYLNNEFSININNSPIIYNHSKNK